MKLTPEDRVIVALDVDRLQAAEALVRELSPVVRWFKVGLELLTAEGAPRVMEFFHNYNSQVFFDGKFHDIPHTVAQAVVSAQKLGVSMLNVHASAGPKALEEAVRNKGNSVLLAVTVLTSHDERECESIFSQGVQGTLERFVGFALDAGVDGLVCSSQDIPTVRRLDPAGKLRLVTPGIRPQWAAKNDQSRIVTPKQALELGADQLVIGRPITQPPANLSGPREAAERILKELS